VHDVSTPPFGERRHDPVQNQARAALEEDDVADGQLAARRLHTDLDAPAERRLHAVAGDYDDHRPPENAEMIVTLNRGILLTGAVLCGL
jgi:hypothetical protein